MNKRTDTIRQLFAQPAPPTLTAVNNPAEQARVPAGAVRALKQTFSKIEEENDALRALAAGAENLVDVDPELIDPSPFADRFAQEDDVSFETLKQSIVDRGQEVPVLLRPHRDSPGRFQTAFGHRRIRVMRQLGRPVRALVRTLSDDELIVAQGVENSAREDLSFIERAVFALKLELAGRDRGVIQQALAIDRTEASRLVAIAKAVPNDLVVSIGKAAKIGRGRWQELADLLSDKMALKRAQALVASPEFANFASDERFMRALRAAKKQETPKSIAQSVVEIRDRTGRPIARIKASGNSINMTLSTLGASEFASFLTGRLAELLEEFRSFVPGNGGRKEG